tara:strand:+ start:93255 stop:93479 length:225 start_codon:yes stop_codon:yes gene_type:complete
MKLIKIKNQHRRDFTGVLQCQSCNHKQEVDGYDDHYYHNTVIPKIECKSCGESTNSLGLKNEPQATKYPEEYQV